MSKPPFRISPLAFVMLVALVPLTAANAAPADDKLATLVYQPRVLTWDPKIQYQYAGLRVVGPEGFVRQWDFGAGRPVFDLSALPGIPDGQYSYELELGKVNPGLEKALARIDLPDDGSIRNPHLAAQIQELRETVSGSFQIQGGQIVSPFLVEPTRPAGKTMRKDQVIPDDLIVQGSTCVGLDCVNGEVFDFDTLRLKENALRIHFLDTSAAGFPANAWRLTANDSEAGGANKFSIDDATAGRSLFTATAGAPSNSLFIASTGKVGFRTSTPLLDLHAATGDTPAIRLEQTAASGFTAQTWDIGANEANFFIRDLTGGSRLSLRIRPGAPTSSLDISSEGNVGIGLLPLVHGAGQRTLHIDGGANGTALRMTNTATGSPSGNGSIMSLVGSDTYLWNLENAFMSFGTNTAERMRITNAGNVGIGTSAPAQKLHVVGNARVEGSLQVTGACCGPDYVFAPGFKVASIEENAAYMWKNRHLPAVGPAQTTDDGKAIVNVFAQSNGMLEELEKAHIYIEKLHNEIKALKSDAVARDAAIRAELAALRQSLGK